jgi:hypothetical protein
MEKELLVKRRKVKLLLEKIPLLLKSLRQNNWHLTVFEIFYKKKYIVVFEDMKEFPHKDAYFSVKLTFVKDDGTNEELAVFANACKMNISLRDFVEYFEIKGDGSYKDCIKDFYVIFNNQMPDSFQPISKIYEKEALRVLNKYEPSNGTCCYDARRNLMPNSNTEYKTRSIFNTEKTKILRPSLFAKIGNDVHISFYYRENDDLDDNTIMRKLREHDAKL